MKKTLLKFSEVFLIIIICLHSSLYSQELHPTRKIPLLEFKSAGTIDYYVIFLTGNGGYRNLAHSLTNYLNSKKISVLAINTKKYLWAKKPPAQIALDLETLLERYNEKWGLNRVVLIGYSMGAEVIPFAVNCMEEKYKDELSNIILIGPWQKATFKINLLDFFFEINKGADIYSELLKMKTKKACVICDDNKISICQKDLEGIIDHYFLKGGHHFGGDYMTLSKLIGRRLKLE
jgi:type IV secretory pathway VirJ component